MLGACGLAAAFLACASGFLDCPILLGVSGAVMAAANLYAMVKS